MASDAREFSFLYKIRSLCLESLRTASDLICPTKFWLGVRVPPGPPCFSVCRKFFCPARGVQNDARGDVTTAMMARCARWFSWPGLRSSSWKAARVPGAACPPSVLLTSGMAASAHSTIDSERRRSVRGDGVRRDMAVDPERAVFLMGSEWPAHRRPAVPCGTRRRSWPPTCVVCSGMRCIVGNRDRTAWVEFDAGHHRSNSG